VTSAIFYINPMLDRITTWLTTAGDYNAGLSLLRKTGYTGFALSVLDMGEDAYTRTRLENELQTWLQKNVSLQQDPEPIILPMVTEQSSAPVIITQPADQPAGIDQVWKEINGLMDLRTEAKAWLRANEHLGNGEAAQALRRPYAYQVKQVTRQIDELMSQVAFFEQYGYLPSPISDDPDVDERALLLNIRSNVSRHKRWLKDPNLTPEQRQAYQAKYNHYLAQKLQLELKLSNPNDSHTSG
jgi:hypothetical protein